MTFRMCAFMRVRMQNIKREPRTLRRLLEVATSTSGRRYFSSMPRVDGTYWLMNLHTFGNKSLLADVLTCVPSPSSNRKRRPLQQRPNLPGQLKSIDAKDYQVAFTPAEMTRLKALFAGGVCDWSKPGVNQVPVVTWASFGPSPKNLVFDVMKTGDGSR